MLLLHLCLVLSSLPSLFLLLTPTSLFFYFPLQAHPPFTRTAPFCPTPHHSPRNTYSVCSQRRPLCLHDFSNFFFMHTQQYFSAVSYTCILFCISLAFTLSSASRVYSTQRCLQSRLFILLCKNIIAILI